MRRPAREILSYLSGRMSVVLEGLCDEREPEEMQAWRRKVGRRLVRQYDRILARVAYPAETRTA